MRKKTKLRSPAAIMDKGITLSGISFLPTHEYGDVPYLCGIVGAFSVILEYAAPVFTASTLVNKMEFKTTSTNPQDAVSSLLARVKEESILANADVIRYSRSLETSRLHLVCLSNFLSAAKVD